MVLLLLSLYLSPSKRGAMASLEWGRDVQERKIRKNLPPCSINVLITLSWALLFKVDSTYSRCVLKL